MAPAKIVGLVVTPTTCLSLISSARLPVSIRSRERSSSQMETPASDRAWSRSVMVPPWRGWWRRSARGRDAVARGIGHRGRGDSELGVDALEVGRGAVVLDRDDPAVVTDDLTPALRDPGLDRDPRLHGGRDDGLAVGRLLSVEPLATRHRHHASGHTVLGEDL